MKQFDEKFGDAIVTFYDKPEEHCVILTARRAPKLKGEKEKSLSKAEEEAAIILAREWFEAFRGIRLLHFHRDPLAGGSFPLHPVDGQVIKAGILRAPSNPMGMPVGMENSQGKVGKIIDEHFPGQGRPSPMVPVSAWTGDW